MRSLVIVFAVLCVTGVSTLPADSCPKPNVPYPSSLFKDEGGIPTDLYQRALAAMPEGFASYLQLKEDSLTSALDDEKAGEDPYTSCQGTDTCEPRTRVIKFWKVADDDCECWNIEPIYWANCRNSDPELTCNLPEGLDTGYRCRKRFRPQPVWVFCDDKSGVPIKPLVLQVSYSCQTMGYKCPETPVLA